MSKLLCCFILYSFFINTFINGMEKDIPTLSIEINDNELDEKSYTESLNDNKFHNYLAYDNVHENKKNSSPYKKYTLDHLGSHVGGYEHMENPPLRYFQIWITNAKTKKQYTCSIYSENKVIDRVSDDMTLAIVTQSPIFDDTSELLVYPKEVFKNPHKKNWYHAKLIKKATTMNFNTFDQNILLLGTYNGHVLIYDIKNKSLNTIKLHSSEVVDVQAMDTMTILSLCCTYLKKTSLKNNQTTTLLENTTHNFNIPRIFFSCETEKYNKILHLTYPTERGTLWHNWKTSSWRIKNEQKDCSSKVTPHEDLEDGFDIKFKYNIEF